MFKRAVFCSLIGLSVSVTAAFADYSAVGNFPAAPSLLNVQNGVWSYGYAPTLNPLTFTLDTTATTDYFNNGTNAEGFYTETSSPSAGLYSLPTVLQNDSSGTLNEGSITSWPTNLLLMHPGPSGDYSVVQFTAPATMTYVISGIFQPLDSGFTSDYVIGPNSSVLYSRTSTATPYNFSVSQALTAGQTIDFAVGLGEPGDQFYNDSTGFNAIITPTPEPELYGILALGCGCLAFFRFRRAKRIASTAETR